MNANEIQLRLENNDICKNKEIGYVTLPLMMLSQKLLTDIGVLLETKYKLSNSELDVLASLEASGNDDYILTPTKLYEKLFFSSGGMTKVLKKLEQKEYIRRVDNKEDKRSKLVQLTKSGKEMLITSLKDVVQLEEEMFCNLDKKDRKELSSLLFKAFKE